MPISLCTRTHSLVHACSSAYVPLDHHHVPGYPLPLHDSTSRPHPPSPPPPLQVLETVRQVSGGDLRKAITYLQSASQLYGSALTPEYIVEIAGVLPPADSDRLWKAIREPRFDDLRPVVRAGRLRDPLLPPSPPFASPYCEALLFSFARRPSYQPTN